MAAVPCQDDGYSGVLATPWDRSSGPTAEVSLGLRGKAGWEFCGPRAQCQPEEATEGGPLPCILPIKIPWGPGISEGMWGRQ